MSWLTDLDFQIRGAISLSPTDGSTTLRVRDTSNHVFRDLITWPMEEVGAAVAFCEDGESLYVTVIPGERVRIWTSKISSFASFFLLLSLIGEVLHPARVHGRVARARACVCHWESP